MACYTEMYDRLMAEEEAALITSHTVASADPKSRGVGQHMNELERRAHRRTAIRPKSVGELRKLGGTMVAVVTE